MQLLTQVPRGDWNWLLGSLLTIGGLALAGWTLAEKQVRALAFRRKHLPLQPVPESEFASALPARRVDADSQWQRVVDIAESEFARIESVLASHAGAVEAVEVADTAMTQMLADCAAAFTPSETEERFEPRPKPAAAPDPVARPLAA